MTKKHLKKIPQKDFILIILIIKNALKILKNYMKLEIRKIINTERIIQIINFYMIVRLLLIIVILFFFLFIISIAPIIINSLKTAFINIIRISY